MYQTLKLERVALLLLGLLTVLLLFGAPELCTRALQEGLMLCGGPLLTSLFPFLIVSTLLIRCGAGEMLGALLCPVTRLIGIRSPAAGGVLLIGLLGGFAPAASACAEAVDSGQISKEEASALLPACICSGPSFVILTVGEQMLHSRALGIRLFVAQVLAGCLTAALLCRLSGKQLRPVQRAQQAEIRDLPRLDAIVTQAAVSYLKLCGFVLYFRLLSAGCAAILPQKWAAFPAMLLEVCSGCDMASHSGLWASSLCCAALSLQSISVLLQVRTICPQEISFRPLLLGRIVHLPLSLAFFSMSLSAETSAEAFSTLCERVIVMRRVPLDCALLAFFVSCMLVCQLSAAPKESGNRKI